MVEPAPHSACTAGLPPELPELVLEESESAKAAEPSSEQTGVVASVWSSTGSGPGAACCPESRTKVLETGHLQGLPRAGIPATVARRLQ